MPRWDRTRPVSQEEQEKGPLPWQVLQEEDILQRDETQSEPCEAKFPSQSSTLRATNKSSSTERVKLARSHSPCTGVMPPALAWMPPALVCFSLVSLSGGSSLLRYDPQVKEDHGAPPAPASSTYHFYKLPLHLSTPEGNQ